MGVSPVSGDGALSYFTQALQQLKSSVQNAPAPRLPDLPPPSPVTQAAKNMGHLLDVKL